MNRPHNKNVLLIAFETPPARSAGVQRPFRFAEYLLEMGWNPIILTASSDVYDRFDHELPVAPELAARIHRAKAWNISKLVSVKGRSPDFLALPDRYWPWCFSATRLGAQLVREHDIGCIWSTYPVMSTHMVARKLVKRFGLPWIADFRDPMQCHYNPHYRAFNGVMRYLERKVIASASKVCTTSTEAAQLYRELYPAEPADKFCTIENGFVPTDLPPASTPGKFTLLYSGALYGNGRDVNRIFRALRLLKDRRLLDSSNFVLRFRGSGKPGRFDAELATHGVADLVEFAPPVPFQQALAEMQQCSANMLIQDEIFRYQIPGKLYDYIQSGKPILAVSPERSATARVCSRLPNCRRAWDDEELAAALADIMQAGSWSPMSPTAVEEFSRRARTGALAELIQGLVAPAGEAAYR